ncbi:MAG: hypothetical protein ACI964_001925, partial [Spirosomataceae bacterium]
KTFAANRLPLKFKPELHQQPVVVSGFYTRIILVKLSCIAYRY